MSRWAEVDVVVGVLSKQWDMRQTVTSPRQIIPTTWSMFAQTCHDFNAGMHVWFLHISTSSPASLKSGAKIQITRNRSEITAMVQVTSGLLNSAILTSLINSVAQIVMNGSISKMITVLVYFSGAPMPGQQRLRGLLQPKSNARDTLLFHLFAYLEHNCIRFKMKNSTVPRLCDDVITDINPV